MRAIRKEYKKKGYTIIEMMVAAVLFSMVIAGLYAALYVGRSGYMTDAGIMDLQQSSRRSMDGMIRELRQSAISDVTINATEEEISFFINASSNAIRYYLNNSTLFRQHPANVNFTMAHDVTSLRFCCERVGACDNDCSASTVLRISLNSAKPVQGRNMTFNLTERVRLRNE